MLLGRLKIANSNDAYDNLQTYLKTTSIATAVSTTPSRNAATAIIHEPVPSTAAEDPQTAQGPDVLSGRLVVVNTPMSAGQSESNNTA